LFEAVFSPINIELDMPKIFIEMQQGSSCKVVKCTGSELKLKLLNSVFVTISSIKVKEIRPAVPRLLNVCGQTDILQSEHKR
jgi:hypothetical protein